MYWPASVKRDIVAVPPESGAVSLPLSQVAVRTVCASVALDFTSTDRKRWLSTLVNHSARRTVSVSSAAASAAATLARACDRSTLLAAKSLSSEMTPRRSKPWSRRSSASRGLRMACTSMPSSTGFLYSARSTPMSASRSTSACSGTTILTRATPFCSVAGRRSGATSLTGGLGSASTGSGLTAIARGNASATAKRRALLLLAAPLIDVPPSACRPGGGSSAWQDARKSREVFCNGPISVKRSYLPFKVFFDNSLISEHFWGCSTQIPHR